MKKETVERALKYSKNFVIYIDDNCGQKIYSNNDVCYKDETFNSKLLTAQKKIEAEINLETTVRDFNEDYIEIFMQTIDCKKRICRATYIIPYENIKEIIVYD